MALLWSAANAPLEGQALQGRIVDALTGAPVPDALVTLEGPSPAQSWTAHSTPDGEYLVEARKAGRYTLQVQKEGYETSRTVGVVLRGSASQRNVHLLPVSARPPTVRPRQLPPVPTSGRIFGKVVEDGSSQAIPDAEVTLDTLRTVTDGRGNFTLDRVPVGRHVLRVRHLAYDSRSDSLTIRHQEVLDMTVSMAVGAVELDPVVVTVYRDPGGLMSGFFQRRARGRGFFYTRLYIEERHPRNFSDIIRETPGVQFQCGIDGFCALRMRRAPPVLGAVPKGQESDCPVQYFVDGVHTVAPQGLDLEILPSEVAAIEVYRGASELPSRYHTIQAARCGAIVVWTRH
jgi:hypothetical protein